MAKLIHGLSEVNIVFIYSQVINDGEITDILSSIKKLG